MQPKPINKISDETHLHRLEKVDFIPIFLRGDHRSGTTAIYQILVASDCFNYLNAYHIIKSDEILDSYINGTQKQTYQEL